jgi:hypothetical protein
MWAHAVIVKVCLIRAEERGTYGVQMFPIEELGHFLGALAPIDV